MTQAAPRAVHIAALCLLVIAASAPAWTGSWVYDDWFMRNNSAMDDAGDLLASFTRSSADYLGRNAVTTAGAVAYRPLSMFSLIACQLIAPESPLLHHLLSLSLHLGSVLLLFGTVRALAGARAASLAALLFALHPLGIEAYGWINGRSDALAALGVSLLAWALFTMEGQRRVALAFGAALCAGLAKETALVAVLGLTAASLLPVRAQPGQLLVADPPWRTAVAPLSAVLSVLIVRTLMVADMGGSFGTLTLPGTVTGMVQLTAMAAGSLLVPQPRTMLNLAHELAQPFSAAQAGVLALLLASLGWLLYARRLRVLMLVLTALAMVAPCIAVRHAFWLGCDRYLYMPLLLLCLSLGFSRIEQGLQTLRPALQLALAGVLALMLSLTTFLTARTYRGQTEHMVAMMEMRPDDPSGFLLGAGWLWNAGNQSGAQQLIDRVPRTGLAPPLASQLATRLGEMKRTREALQVVADMETRYPDDPFAQLNVFAVHLDQGRLHQATTKLLRLGSRRSFCRAARNLIQEHLDDSKWTSAQRAQATDMLGQLVCP